jgi:hypothetical protein
MQNKFYLGALPAVQSVTVNSFETRIQGEVQPFVSSFKTVKFNLTIKEHGYKGVSINSSVQMNSSLGGAELAQYLRAVQAAKQWIEETECFAENLSDHSDAAYAITDAIANNNMDLAYRYVTLLSGSQRELPARCNWNYRSENSRKDNNIVEAILYHDAFKPILEAMRHVFELCIAERFDDITDEMELKAEIGRILITKVNLDSQTKNESAYNLAIATLISQGYTTESLSKRGEKRENVDMLVKELLESASSSNK